MITSSSTPARRRRRRSRMFARLAPRAVLVAPELDNPETALAREQLLKAGFANVSVLVNAPRGPEVGTTGAKAAA